MDQEATFLVVRASRPPFEWVLPKGHIKKGETPEQAAHREVLEESGVDAKVIAPVGDETFVFDGDEVRVRYFLMHMRRSGLESEDRESRWCSLAEAEQLLQFRSSREILGRAALAMRNRS